MATIDAETNIRTILAFWLANRLRAKTQAEKASKRQARARNNTGPWYIATIKLMLNLAGFGLLTYAGFEWSTIAGLVIAGISCFVVSWLVTSGPEQRPNRTEDRMR